MCEWVTLFPKVVIERNVNFLEYSLFNKVFLVRSYLDVDGGVSSFISGLLDYY